MAHWYGVVAVERSLAQPLEQRLSRECAGELGSLIARQIARHLPGEARYGLGLAAALYDPAQLLRRSFPVHREIVDLATAGQRQGVAVDSVLALSARDGQMPTATLEPETQVGSGTLLGLPIVLWGEPSAIEAATQRLETELYEHGLADPEIALALGSTGESFEHVRLMSIADLMAMMAAQLEHVGLSPAWLLIEESLLAEHPRRLDVKSRLGQAWRLRGDSVELDFQTLADYARSVPVDHPEPMLGDYLERVHEFRQTQNLLSAHGLSIDIQPAAQAGFVVDRRRAGEPARALLHEHGGLGALAFTTIDDQNDALAHYYPVTAEAIGDFLRAQRERAVPILRPGRVVLSDDGMDLGTLPY